eukprot:357845-Chlamydomonas_euryale.AAC.3
MAADGAREVMCRASGAVPHKPCAASTPRASMRTAPRATSRPGWGGPARAADHRGMPARLRSGRSTGNPDATPKGEARAHAGNEQLPPSLGQLRLPPAGKFQHQYCVPRQVAGRGGGRGGEGNLKASGFKHGGIAQNGSAALWCRQIVQHGPRS